MSMPYTAITDATIRSLVDTFYTGVRTHPDLGPIFASAIAEPAWPDHLGTMYAFWSSVMLGSGRYKGNPVAIHQHVAGITPPLFATWLVVFESTATALFVPPLADRFVQSARRIAESLKLALFFRPGHPWPDDLRHPATAAPPCA